MPAKIAMLIGERMKALREKPPSHPRVHEREGQEKTRKKEFMNLDQ
jgi:hypothetical protein